jgi:hypothetical protein
VRQSDVVAAIGLVGACGPSQQRVHIAAARVATRGSAQGLSPVADKLLSHLIFLNFLHSISRVSAEEVAHW